MRTYPAGTLDYQRRIKKVPDSPNEGDQYPINSELHQRAKLGCEPRLLPRGMEIDRYRQSRADHAGRRRWKRLDSLEEFQSLVIQGFVAGTLDDLAGCYAPPRVQTKREPYDSVLAMPRIRRISFVPLQQRADLLLPG